MSSKRLAPRRTRPELEPAPRNRLSRTPAQRHPEREVRASAGGVACSEVKAQCVPILGPGREPRHSCGMWRVSARHLRANLCQTQVGAIPISRLLASEGRSLRLRDLVAPPGLRPPRHQRYHSRKRPRANPSFSAHHVGRIGACHQSRQGGGSATSLTERSHGCAIIGS
jgi:hypothetical protein